MESKPSPYLKHIYVCTNQREPGKTCCAARGAERILEKLKGFVQANGLKGRVRVSRSGCMDLCEQGVTVMVYPDNRWYSHVTLETAHQIIEEHLAPIVIASAAKQSQSEIASSAPAVPPRNDKVRAFLFDLGNVLVRFDHLEAARKITAGTGVPAQALFKMFFESPLVVAHDEGRISTEEFYGKVREQIGLDLPFDRFLEVWNNIFAEDKRMTELVGRLAERYPCYLISNTNRPHFEHLRTLCPVLDRLRGHILSYEVGHLKPHPAIYQRALEVAGLPAPQILYVDDRTDLIEAAKPLGFQTYPFAGVDLFIREMESRSILNGR